ncbi:hypothetical protein LIER_27715 [Lithospermum erythrorhizon]|uniref:Reverse transcriptase n=1 Tax=Lithospermum erythrorhizon TaxID=34254 RepID=A0AAV3RE77_LITER
MLREAEERKGLTGIKISRESPSISHILCADDTMIFCKANGSEAVEIVSILRDYEEASGQKVNIDKCSASFDLNTPQGTRRLVLEVLGMNEVMDHGKYLGLPS